MPKRPSLLDFQAVLFDIDGTLVDSLFRITQGLGDTILHYCGFRPEEPEIRQMVGLPLLKQMAVFAKDPTMIQPMANHAMERIGVHSHGTEERYFDATVECLKLCHQNGIRTALVTSKNAIERDAFMNSFSSRTYVDTVVCASDVSEPKPSPESALLACERLQLSPSDCAFVGDSIYDMRCGKSAGTACIAVAYGAGAHDALEAEQPDLLFTLPEQLLLWAQESLTHLSCHARK